MKKSKKYLIIGGGFHNNGAESMLYTLVSELKDREPGCEVFVGMNKVKSDRILNDYNFKIIENYTELRKRLLSFKTSFKDFIRGKKNELNDILNKIDVVFDISGFALSSQWGVEHSSRFLNVIKLAKRYRTKVILMPQSFGPFDYGEHKIPLIKDIKKTLSKVDLIFCREKEGYELLKELGLKNIELSTDMVLQRGKEYSNIIKNNVKLDIPEIKDNSVLIIPNERVHERMNHDNFMNIYKEVISHLLAKNMNVYISYYADDDVALAKEIANLINNANIHLLDKKYNCLEYEKIFSKFKFVISSRFHSVVHSYKNFVPCLVLGWAVKYKELCHSVNQDDIMFDCRENVNIHDIINATDTLITNRESRSFTIKEAVTNIQQNSCFNRIWEVLKK